MKKCLAYGLLLIFFLALNAAQAQPPSSSVAALLQAANLGDNAKIQTLLNQGVDVNSMQSGYTALMVAAAMNHLATVKMLLDKGAFVDAPNPYNSDNKTPLMIASCGWLNSIALPTNLKSPKPIKTKTDLQIFLNAVFQWQHGYYDI